MEITPNTKALNSDEFGYKSTNVAVILGAGATCMEASALGGKVLPPLDRGFFDLALKIDEKKAKSIISLVDSAFGIDLLNPKWDSLEYALSLIYSSVEGVLERESIDKAVNGIHKLLLSCLGETTNQFEPTSSAPIYKLIDKFLSLDSDPGRLSVITFNYDLQVEKALQYMAHHEHKYLSLDRSISAFPQYYGLPHPFPIEGQDTGKKYFTIAGSEVPYIRLLKLHGSVNWYSVHRKEEPPTHVLFDKNREISIETSREIRPSFRYRGVKRGETALPVIIPPVNHKSGILPLSLLGVWDQAKNSLAEADLILVCGYSCPIADIETVSLIRRALRNRHRVPRLIVNDINPAVVVRFEELFEPRSTQYYRSFDSMLDDLPKVLVYLP